LKFFEVSDISCPQSNFTIIYQVISNLLIMQKYMQYLELNVILIFNFNTFHMSNFSLNALYSSNLKKKTGPLCPRGFQEV
jgi:Leucine-rich repeat (LRR) protein